MSLFMRRFMEAYLADSEEFAPLSGMSAAMLSECESIAG